MDLGLKGKVAIVTGGTQGIGKATALRLAAEGAHVVICARGQELLDEVAAEIREAGGKAHAVAADVSTPQAGARIVDEAIRAFGRIDILVNNAGTSATGAFESVTDETWQADFDLKLFGAIRLIRLGTAAHEAAGRRADHQHHQHRRQAAGAPESMPTTVTRAAGLAMTKALSKEFAADGILVNTVCIGLVRAGQHEKTAASRGIDGGGTLRDAGPERAARQGRARPRRWPTSSPSWRRMPPAS